MISFVTFDYFSPSDYIDMGFTETPAWSVRFEWLKYETVNFVDSMGSILIYVGLQLAHLLLSVILSGLRRVSRNDFLQSYFAVSASLKKSLTFIHGTFFEILVAASIAMKMLTFSDYLNRADWVSLYLAFFCGAVLLIYVIYLLYFTLFKSAEFVTAV